MRVSNSFSEAEISCLDLIMSYMLRSQAPPDHLTRQAAFKSAYAKVLKMKKSVATLRNRERG